MNMTVTMTILVPCGTVAVSPLVLSPLAHDSVWTRTTKKIQARKQQYIRYPACHCHCHRRRRLRRHAPNRSQRAQHNAQPQRPQHRCVNVCIRYEITAKATPRRGGARRGGCVDDVEADFLGGLGGVVAVCGVYFWDVFGVCKGDVCALGWGGNRLVWGALKGGGGVGEREREGRERGSTHVIQGAAMLCEFDNLNGGIVAHGRGVVCWQRDLGQAKGAVVLEVGGACDLEDGEHDVGVVERLVAVAHVDVEHGEGVAGEPAGLDGDGTAVDRPFGPVLRHGHAAACEEGGDVSRCV